MVFGWYIGRTARVLGLVAIPFYFVWGVAVTLVTLGFAEDKVMIVLLIGIALWGIYGFLIRRKIENLVENSDDRDLHQGSKVVLALGVFIIAVSFTLSIHWVQMVVLLTVGIFFLFQAISLGKDAKQLKREKAKKRR